MTPFPSPADPQRLPFGQCLALVEAAQAQLAEPIAGEYDPLKAALDRLTVQFQQQIQPLGFEDWPPSQRSLLASVRVEMHKQLRLLGTDLMFLGAARRSGTAQQRLGQVGDRLTALAGYCSAVLEAPAFHGADELPIEPDEAD